MMSKLETCDLRHEKLDIIPISPLMTPLICDVTTASLFQVPSRPAH